MRWRATRVRKTYGYLGRLQGLPGLPELLRRGRTLLPTDAIRIVADLPLEGRERRRLPGVLGAVADALAGVGNRVLVISPYFVPSRRGARSLIALARRGVWFRS
jgi:phosphatidylserine/phosphatidylglycerophosphate/cardiolipin synthase-like enzyme